MNISNFNDYESLVISNIIAYDCQSITTTDFYDENSPDIILESGEDVENQLIKADLFNRLSEEAKHVLKVIANSPAELLEMASIKGKPTERLARYLRKKWSGGKVRQVMVELKKYNKEVQ